MPTWLAAVIMLLALAGIVSAGNIFAAAEPCISCVPFSAFFWPWPVPYTSG